MPRLSRLALQHRDLMTHAEDLRVIVLIARRASGSETSSRAVSWGLLRDQRRGWDHLRVLLSLVCRLVRLCVPKTCASWADAPQLTVGWVWCLAPGGPGAMIFGLWA